MVNLLTVATWLSQFAIMGTYSWWVFKGTRGTGFHATNALTAPFIIAYDVALGAYGVILLPIWFGAWGLIGWYGDWRDRG